MKNRSAVWLVVLIQVVLLVLFIRDLSLSQ
jgi:hypothetical protein